jgi:hypothetical protein
VQAADDGLALAAAVAQQLQVGCGEALTGHECTLASPAGLCVCVLGGGAVRFSAGHLGTGVVGGVHVGVWGAEADNSKHWC